MNRVSAHERFVIVCGYRYFAKHIFGVALVHLDTTDINDRGSASYRLSSPLSILLGSTSE